MKDELRFFLLISPYRLKLIRPIPIESLFLKSGRLCMYRLNRKVKTVASTSMLSRRRLLLRIDEGP